MNFREKWLFLYWDDEKNIFQFSLFFFVFASGCSYVISGDLRAKVDRSLTFNDAQKNPNTYKGKMVLWGGEIIQTLPQKDGTTLVEVLQWQLGWRGEPKRIVSFQGKFLILVNEYLDPVLYRGRKKITVAGEILGEIQGDKIEYLTEIAYRYPLILSKQIHVWKDYSFPYSSSPQYYSDPFWYNPLERQVPF